MRFKKTFALVAVAGLTLACNSERRDAALNQEVMAKLSEDPQLARNAVNVETEHGNVTLTGEVMTEDQRRIAAERAQEVKGVRQVTNKLELAVSSPAPATPDASTPPEVPAPPSASAPPPEPNPGPSDTPDAGDSTPEKE
jgi:BON domain-containing protein